MLRNDREGLYHVMATMADEPGMVRVRIFDQRGRISYSTDPAEVGHIVDKGAEACYGCHAQSQPLTRLNRPDRFRIYRDGKGQRVLGIITPIENQPACSNAACHAHPPSQQILGVLDTNLSLAKADAQLAADQRDSMLAYTLLALLAIVAAQLAVCLASGGQPAQALEDRHEANWRRGTGLPDWKSIRTTKSATWRHSFNTMSLQLRAANEEIIAWAHTLEDRVEQKTRELKRAHEHMLHVEKMATIGKMAAVVAHEINNPLSGILTYAKLVRKWIDAAESQRRRSKQEARAVPGPDRQESRRCGDLVKNLLTFSRTSPMNCRATDVNAVIDRCVRLVQHQLEMKGIELHADLAPRLAASALRSGADRAGGAGAGR